MLALIAHWVLFVSLVLLTIFTIANYSRSQARVTFEQSVLLAFYISFAVVEAIVLFGSF